MKKVMPSTGTISTISMKVALTLLCYTLLWASAAPAQTLQQIKSDPGSNEGPPPGAILDLNGQAIPGAGNGTYQQYTVNFTATLSNTAITFAFRDDPAFLFFAEATVTDLTNPSGNLLLNGDFSGGTYTYSVNGVVINGFVPSDWIYANMYGATYGGVVEPTASDVSCGSIAGVSVFYCWWDGAVQAYDAISQTITTNVGDTYQISFYLAEDSSCSTDTEYNLPCNFSDISTNGDTTDTGGNGIDVTVYAQASLPPPPVTEQLTVTLYDSGSGTVTDNSTPPMITCSEQNGTVSGTCIATYPMGAMVTLTASANEGSTFAGWGGACASSGTNPTCTVTMNSAQSVTAAFIVPGQTQTQTVSTTATTTYQFSNNAYNYFAQLTSGSSTSATVTAILMTPQACNELVQQTYPSAQCFVYTGLAPNPDSAILFELTCPNLSNDQCNPFNAELGTNFDLSTESGVNNYNPTDPFPGWLKGFGGVAAHPCTPPASGPLFQSDQIDFFSLSRLDPGDKGKSGGSGSCWTGTYGQNDQMPPGITITSPTNTTYAQGATVPAIYSCNNPTTSQPSTSSVGPYLTAASCTQSSGTQTACTTTASGLSCTGTVNTSTVGTQPFTVVAMDTGTNANTKSVNYMVVAPTNLQILNVGLPGAVATGGTITYNIGVADLGPVNAVEVMVTDSLPSNTTFVSASGINISCPIVNRKLSCTTTPISCSASGNTVSCNVGTLEPLAISSLNGGTMQITVQVTGEPTTTCKVGKSQQPCTIDTAWVSAINTDTNGNPSSTTQTIW